MELSALREEIRKTPFQPFSLRMSDGSSVAVFHQEFIAIAPPRNVIVTKQEGGYEVLDVLHIVAIDRTEPPRRPRGGNGR